MIAALFRAGADVFRINMSHTSHDRMRELVSTIRSVEEEFGRPIGILVDLQGPKLRVGRFAANASGPPVLDWSTQLPVTGSGNTQPFGLAPDGTGALYVVGQTKSSAFPVVFSKSTFAIGLASPFSGLHSM